MRNRLSTDFIVIHNLATSPSMDWGWTEVDRYHRSKGWRMGGYHFVIARNGDLQTGRPLDVFGAHVAGLNDRSIGIALSGGIAERPATPHDSAAAQERGWVPLPNRPENNFTPEQFNTLETVLFDMRGKFPAAKIVGYGDLDEGKPHCPGFDLKKFLSDKGL